MLHRQVEKRSGSDAGARVEGRTQTASGIDGVHKRLGVPQATTPKQSSRAFSPTGDERSKAAKTAK